MPNTFELSFYLGRDTSLFARRIMTQVPVKNDRIVFNNHRYLVHAVEWCLDDDATDYAHQALINVILTDLEQDGLPPLRGLPPTKTANGGK